MNKLSTSAKSDQSAEARISHLEPLVVRKENRNKTKLYITDRKGFYLLNLQDIVYLSSIGNYTNINLLNKEKLLFAKTLKKFEEALPNEFFRIHQQHIINRRFIYKVESNEVTLKNGNCIPIAKGRKKQFQTWIVDQSTIVV